MRYSLSCVLVLCSCFLTLNAIELKDFNWSEQIQGEAITLKRLPMEMPSFVSWSIQDEEDRSVGMIFISEGAQGINADFLSQNKVFELSYVVKEQGCGLGSKAVKAWIDNARQNAWGKHVYALVDAKNTPSVRILEKNGCLFKGSYSDQELTILVYSLE